MPAALPHLDFCCSTRCYCQKIRGVDQSHFESIHPACSRRSCRELSLIQPRVTIEQHFDRHISSYNISLKHTNRLFQTFRILKNIRSCAASLAGPPTVYFCLYTFTERANPCSGTVLADPHLERPTTFILEELEKFSAHWTCTGGLCELLLFEEQDNLSADLLACARSLISKASRFPDYAVNHYVVNHSPRLHNQTTPTLSQLVPIRASRLVQELHLTSILFFLFHLPPSGPPSFNFAQDGLFQAP